MSLLNQDKLYNVLGDEIVFETHTIKLGSEYVKIIRNLSDGYTCDEHGYKIGRSTDKPSLFSCNVGRSS